mmetsp:Transcript_20628/g.62967  ORF Transcript_20628/g.62967 Transcript_20628/m.62967 type:complete len:514 (+) Transcript_20628:178-1719(+)
MVHVGCLATMRLGYGFSVPHDSTIRHFIRDPRTTQQFVESNHSSHSRPLRRPRREVSDSTTCSCSSGQSPLPSPNVPTPRRLSPKFGEERAVSFRDSRIFDATCPISPMSLVRGRSPHEVYDSFSSPCAAAPAPRPHSSITSAEWSHAASGSTQRCMAGLSVPLHSRSTASSTRSASHIAFSTGAVCTSKPRLPRPPITPRSSSSCAARRSAQRQMSHPRDRRHAFTRSAAALLAGSAPAGSRDRMPSTSGPTNDSGSRSARSTSRPPQTSSGDEAPSRSWDMSSCAGRPRAPTPACAISDSRRSRASSASRLAAAAAAISTSRASCSAFSRAAFSSASAASLAALASLASFRSRSRCALLFGLEPSPKDSASALAASRSFRSFSRRFSSGSSSAIAESCSASMSRYSSNSPGNLLTLPSSMTQISLHTLLINSTLWVITMTPPSKARRPSTRQSTVSRSRWLVGSSSNNRCVRRRPISTKTTRDFWPPESVEISCRWWWPSRPKRPSALRMA